MTKGGRAGPGSARLLSQRPNGRVRPTAAAALRTEGVTALRLHQPGSVKHTHKDEQIGKSY